MKIKLWHSLKKAIHARLDKEFHTPFREEAIRIKAVQAEVHKFGTFVEIPLEVLWHGVEPQSSCREYADRVAIEQIGELMLKEGCIKVYEVDDYERCKRRYRYEVEAIEQKGFDK